MDRREKRGMESGGREQDLGGGSRRAGGGGGGGGEGGLVPIYHSDSWPCGRPWDLTASSSSLILALLCSCCPHFSTPLIPPLLSSFRRSSSHLSSSTFHPFFPSCFSARTHTWRVFFVLLLSPPPLRPSLSYFLASFFAPQQQGGHEECMRYTDECVA